MVPPVSMYGQHSNNSLFLLGHGQDARQEHTVLALQQLFHDCKGVWSKNPTRRSGLTVVDHLNDSAEASPGEHSW